jgi:hypothetical protein
MALAKRRRPSLELVVVLLPILVASIQIYFALTSDLTRWRGGGFGMYTDPHPHVNRTVWVEGSRAGSPAALRLYPLDERLQQKCMRFTRLRRDLSGLRRAARAVRNFPSLTGIAPVCSAVDEFLAEHGDQREIDELFPRDALRVRVVQGGISRDFRHYETRTIHGPRPCSR